MAKQHHLVFQCQWDRDGDLEMASPKQRDDFEREEAFGLVDYLCGVGHRHEIHFLWRPALPDPRDEFILELAVAAGCEAIVTHNVRDFAGADRFGIAILTPGAFLGRLRMERS